VANFVVEVASCFTLAQMKSKVVHTRPMKTLIRMEVLIHSFLGYVLDVAKWSALRPGPFTSSECSPGTVLAEMECDLVPGTL
jgi:hypothetical protein